MKMKDEYAQAEVPMLPVVIGMQKTSKFILGNTLILIPYSLLILILIPDGLGLVYTSNCICIWWIDAWCIIIN